MVATGEGQGLKGKRYFKKSKGRDEVGKSNESFGQYTWDGSRELGAQNAVLGPSQKHRVSDNGVGYASTNTY